MLPFLKPKKIASMIIAHKKANGTEETHEEGEMPSDMMAAAEDLISAINMKDAKGVAMALQAAMDICAAQPSEDMERI